MIHKEKKKDKCPWEMLQTEPRFVFARLYMQLVPADKVREPNGVQCCSKVPGAMAKVHFPPKKP